MEKRAQTEAAVASPPAASPEAEPEAAGMPLGNTTRTHTHAASLRKHRKWGSPGSNAIFRRKSYIRAYFAY